MKVSHFYVLILGLGFIFLSLPPLSALEQLPEHPGFKVQGYFNKESQDSLQNQLASKSVLVRMTLADTVFQTTYIKDNGIFEFLKLAPNQNFKLQYYYLLNEFIPNSAIDFQKNNMAIVYAQFDLTEFADSVKTISLKKLKSFYVFGHGLVDRRIKILALKYGMYLKGEGCQVPPGGEEVYNKETLDDLTKMWGQNWYHNVYWKEIHSKVFHMHEK